MKKPFSLIAIPILLFMNSCFKYQSEKADLIVHNATIYQLDNSFSKTDAMAVKEGKIIAIGPENEIRNKYTATNIVDAKKLFVYPGFIDAHCHFMWYAKSLQEVNLTGSKSWDEAVNRVVEFQGNNNNKWIMGRGWDQNLWEDRQFPTKKKLDSIYPETAVILWRVDAHAAIVNQKALDLAGITQTTIVEGGKIELNDGKPTGMIFDMAIEEVKRAIPKRSTAELAHSILQAEKNCFAVGLTTVSDALMENQDVHTIDELHKDSRLKMKMYGMLSPSSENKKEFLAKGPYKTERLHIGAFKYFADGALGSKGAKLLLPYSDDPENRGTWVSDSNYLASEAIEMHENGFQMATHCIGDASNRMVLNMYANALGGTNDKRWRIEHAQIITKVDMVLFRKYNIIPSVQPTHATSDMPWAEERLGKERMPSAYAYNELMQQNGMIALGTDFPIEGINPIHTFYAAVSRKNADSEPADGFLMENALSREDALKGMTIWAAIANFEEEDKGSLEVGKTADFVILDKNLLQVQEKEILSTKVIATYINGEKVYEKN